MSESTSSPSVQVLPISPSSSSTNSAPRSELTSDEEPDLGAFNQVLREWTYLQPQPRIPIHIRSATSSTSPTYHAEQSLNGDDIPSRSGLSTVSSFTRAPTSSIHPDGSTVWVHPPIASYLFSNTPSNEQYIDGEEMEDVYSPSLPVSRASTALTVDIASELDFTSLDDESHDSGSNRNDLSPETDSAIPVSVAGESQPLDSRDTAHTEGDLLSDRGVDSSETSRNYVRPPLQERTITSSSQDSSDPSILSIQLQSQAVPDTITIRSSSVALSEDPGVSISIAGESSNSIDSAIGPSNTSGSTATLMNDFFNRSRNPIPPPTASDSSYLTTGTASNFSLVSYQMPVTPSPAVEHEDSDVERSTEACLRTQQGLTDDSTSVLASERSQSSIFVTSTASPLLNPHSLPPTPESSYLNTNHGHLATAIFVGNDSDLGTPDQPPSEAILFAPSRHMFEPIRDDEDGALAEQSVETQHCPHLSTSDSHHTQSQSTVHSGEQGTDAQRYSSDDYHDAMEGDTHHHSRTTYISKHLSAHAPIGISDNAQTLANTEEALSSTSYSFLQRQFGVFGNSSGTQSQERAYSAHLKPKNHQILDIYSHSDSFSRGPIVASSNQVHSEPDLQQSPFSQLSELPSFVFPSLVGQLYHDSSQSSTSLASLMHNHPHSSSHFPLEPIRSSVLLDLSIHPLETNSTLREIDPQFSDIQTEPESPSDWPSLGYLDEALSFIAAERARWTAARESTNGLNVGGNSSETGAISEDEAGGESRSNHKEEEEASNQVFDTEKGPEQPKRKRRRKKPSKLPLSEIPPDSSLPNFTEGTSSHRAQFPTPESSPKKRRSKSASPSLSVSVSMSSEKSGTTTTPGKQKSTKRRDKEFLVPPPLSSSNSKANVRADSDIDDGGRTPTNSKVPGLIDISMLSGINLLGKKGKRVGRREREREKLHFDMVKSPADKNANASPLGGEYDINETCGGSNRNEGTEQGNKEDDGEENDSISNMSLLQPPRRKSLRREDTDGRHSFTGITYLHKSMPASPVELFSFRKQVSGVAVQHPVDIPKYGKEVIDVSKQDENVGGKKEKKRGQPSISSSKLQTQAESAPPNSKRGRLITLAQNLQRLFPEQHEELARVIKRMGKQAVSGEKKVWGSAINTGSDGSSVVKSIPISVKTKKTKKGHDRSLSDGMSSLGPDLEGDALEIDVGRAVTDVEEEKSEEDLDPRGRPPKKKDPMIHVFIDHSNILIGLLSHLKRVAPHHKQTSTKRHSASVIPTTAESSTNAKVEPVAASSTAKPSARPLPILPPASGAVQRGLTSGPTKSVEDYPIPLPSFARVSHSLPSTSLLTTKLRPKDSEYSSDEIEHQKASEGDRVPEIEYASVQNNSNGSLSLPEDKKKPLKHLWHAALILILERGRPTTRRVVVASSPLYQPMETIERLDYDLRVYIRVPDAGDGIDRERRRDKTAPGKSNISGKGIQASPTKNAHLRHISGNISTESGSGGNASGTGSSSLHPYHGTNDIGAPQNKVKFREQGVDELLQLKLHQAIAATDRVPDGSTIVLATGDGNMGQFNEEGFLGPIRTALRRGWRVELYAWEDGLSRAWKREFGEGTEWSKRGMFRIIGMEQFASWLVEASAWA